MNYRLALDETQIDFSRRIGSLKKQKCELNLVHVEIELALMIVQCLQEHNEIEYSRKLIRDKS